MGGRSRLSGDLREQRALGTLRDAGWIKRGYGNYIKLLVPETVYEAVVRTAGQNHENWRFSGNPGQIPINEPHRRGRINEDLPTLEITPAKFCSQSLSGANLNRPPGKSRLGACAAAWGPVRAFRHQTKCSLRQMKQEDLSFR